MISLIACVGKNNELGLNGDLVFRIKEDMHFFKTITTGHPVLMGAKTCASLPGALAGRTNYVLTHHSNKLPAGFIAVSDLEVFIKEHQDENIFVIGGAKVYELLLPYADEIYLTEVDANADADVYFPTFDKNLYNKIIIDKGISNGIEFTFAKYIKK